MQESYRGARVRIPKAAEIVAGWIRNAIIRGELADGDCLPSEARLIESFEVSRPTIREAIRVLEVENLLRVSRGARGGPRVCAPTTDMVARAAGIALQSKGVTVGDLYEARSILEPPAARLVAQRNAKKGARILRAHVEKEFAVAEDVLRVTSEIAHFHRLLVEQAENQTLTVVAHALQGLVERHLELVQRHTALDHEMHVKRIRYGLRSHQKLVDLIEQRQAAEAEQHWFSHMRAAGTHWVDAIPPTSVVDLLEPYDRQGGGALLQPEGWIKTPAKAEGMIFRPRDRARRKR